MIGVGLGPTLIGALSVLMAQHAFGAGSFSMLCPVALRPREPRLPWHRPVARLRPQALCRPSALLLRYSSGRRYIFLAARGLERNLNRQYEFACSQITS